MSIGHVPVVQTRRLLFLLALCPLLFAPVARALTLCRDGKPVAKICLLATAPADIQAAATELAAVLEQMSGAKLEIVKADGPTGLPKPAIVLGELAGRCGLKMQKHSRAGDGYRYKVQDGRLLVGGESPRGVYHGVFAFLETLGCGWYVPGKVGEVIPRNPTVEAADGLDHSEVSDSVNRRFWYGGKNGVGKPTELWRRRNGGECQRGSWSHAWAGLVSKQTYFKDHPEYFSLNRGKRTGKQLCTTNPDTIRIAAQSLIQKMKKSDLVVLPAGPNDGGNLCECPECTKLDTPGYLEPSSGKPACTTRVFKFARDLAEITSKSCPDKDLGILVYSEYSRTPLKLKKLHPNVFPMFAPIRRCRLHGPGNPLCPWNMLWQQEIRDWGKLTDKMGFYIYNYNLADALVPISKISFYRRTVDEVHKLNVHEVAWVFETIDSWAMYAPHLYLSVRLSWNSHIDIDAEMDRFFTGFYGEAAAPMKRYWLGIDHKVATTPVHTGSQYGLHHIWTPELLAASRKDIEEAKRLARTDRVKEAVAMAEAGLHCAELFIKIHNSEVACEFLDADKYQQQLQAHIKMMAARPDPHWAHERYAWGYYRRFTGLTVSGGAQVLKAGGKVLVKLPDVWKFAKDEKQVGAKEGWWQPACDDRAWQDFGTSSKSWDDQGLGWYHGDGWYRTGFVMPATAKGADLRLWFGGFDYNADVYLNGHHLGEQRGFAVPREFKDIAQWLKPGERNILAVRVSAGDLAELGTGGLMAPVMIYQARAGKPADATQEKGVKYKM